MGRRPKTPTPEPAPPPPPTINEATASAENADKLKRRRGRLATLYAGRSPALSPPAAGKTMTGQ